MRGSLRAAGGLRPIPGEGGFGMWGVSDGELTLLRGDGGGGLRLRADEAGMVCEDARGVVPAGADGPAPVRGAGGRYSIGIGVRTSNSKG